MSIKNSTVVVSVVFSFITKTTSTSYTHTLSLDTKIGSRITNNVFTRVSGCSTPLVVLSRYVVNWGVAKDIKEKQSKRRQSGAIF